MDQPTHYEDYCNNHLSSLPVVQILGRQSSEERLAIVKLGRQIFSQQKEDQSVERRDSPRSRSKEEPQLSEAKQGRRSVEVGGLSEGDENI